MKGFVMGNRAFSLIELLVVITVIGILAAAATFAYQNYTYKSRIASIIPVMENYARIANAYYAQHGHYDDAQTMGFNASGPTLNVNGSPYSVPGGEGVGPGADPNTLWIVFWLDENAVGNGTSYSIYEMDVTATDTTFTSAVSPCNLDASLIAPSSWNRTNLTSPTYWETFGGFCPTAF